MRNIGDEISGAGLHGLLGNGKAVASSSGRDNPKKLDLVAVIHYSHLKLKGPCLLALDANLKIVAVNHAVLLRKCLLYSKPVGRCLTVAYLCAE